MVHDNYDRYVINEAEDYKKEFVDASERILEHIESELYKVSSILEDYDIEDNKDMANKIELAMAKVNEIISRI